MLNKTVYKSSVLFFTTLLASCVSQIPAPEKPLNQTMSVQARKIQLDDITSWNISGAIAAKQQRKGWTASVSWRQSGASNYQIRLFGPLGSGSVLVKKQGNKVIYQDGKKKYYGNNAEVLISKYTGVRVPVSNLYFWVRGLPAPGGASSLKYDQFKHLSSFMQNGFHVQFQRYTSVKGTDLPSKIVVTNGSLRLKFIIKRWSIG
jgi:outer membrane lipoprotein LolB